MNGSIGREACMTEAWRKAWRQHQSQYSPPQEMRLTKHFDEYGLFFVDEPGYTVCYRARILAVTGIGRHTRTKKERGRMLKKRLWIVSVVWVSCEDKGPCWKWWQSLWIGRREVQTQVYYMIQEILTSSVDLLSVER